MKNDEFKKSLQFPTYIKAIPFRIKSDNSSIKNYIKTKTNY